MTTKTREHLLLAKQGGLEVSLLHGDTLQLVERNKFGPPTFHRKAIHEWSLWRHEGRYVLCPQLTPWCSDRFPFEGDPTKFLELGILDCRDRLTTIVDRLVDLTRTNLQGGVVPFIVADDPFDAEEALGAAKAYFHTVWMDDQELRFPLRSTRIVDWHEHRMQYQHDGSFDVALGMSHRPLDTDETHEAWIRAIGDQHRNVWGTRSVVITGPEHFGRVYPGASSFNFCGLLDSGVSQIFKWGFSAAIVGTWDSWFGLARSEQGPLEHCYELVHIPATSILAPEFARLMAAEFECWNGGCREDVMASMEFSPELAEAIWVAAGKSKCRALELVRTVAGECERTGQLCVGPNDVIRLTSNGHQIGQVIYQDQDISPAMRYRNSLEFGAEFDTRRSEIAIYKDLDSGRFVVTVFPKLPSDGPEFLKVRHAYFAAADAKAKSLWLEKYHQDMPRHVEHVPAETSFPDAIPYIGTVQLTQEETDFLKKTKTFGDFTLDMLWLIVEGIGWRPGKPVSEADPGWLAVWAEEEECGGYYEIVRAVLAMPALTYIGNETVMPSSVRAVYA